MHFTGNPDSTSLAQAKGWLRTQFEDGAPCPCCNQFVKLYKRPMNGSMAYALILINKYFKNNSDWLHVPSYLLEQNLPAKVGAAIRGDWAKLKFWGMIEPKEEIRPDGSDRAGLYRITETGRKFVQNELAVPKYQLLYNQVVVRPPEGPMVKIQDVLGDKFDYTALMNS